jgi:hypothetical protein
LPHAILGGHSPAKGIRNNLDTNREALERLDPSSMIKKAPRWRRDASVLAWLDSLGGSSK